MASFQQDFNLNNLPSIINFWKNSAERKRMMDGERYYYGNNITIEEVKRYYYSQKYKCLKENKAVSNVHIANNLFHDIVSQKVNTLLREAPIINNFEDKKFKRQLGYTLKRAAIKASNAGKAFVLLNYNNTLTVFDSENCIPFYDDAVKDKLRALIRFWETKPLMVGASGGIATMIVQVYEEDGITTYSGNAYASQLKETEPKTPYRYNIIRNFNELERIENTSIGVLPIVEVRNNEDRISDLQVTNRSKIDAIDIIESGLVNNIQDFSDVYWTIKDKTGLDEETWNDFTASINRSKMMVVRGDDSVSPDATPHQFEIPYEARKTTVDMFKRELIEENGLLDTASLTGSSLTTTAIQAATLKLQQRVADFEWQIHDATQTILEMYNLYNNKVDVEYEIDFNWLLIKNDKEMIETANMLYGRISNIDYLKLIERAGYISDYKETLAEMEKEGASLMRFLPEDESGVEDEEQSPNN